MMMLMHAPWPFGGSLEAPRWWYWRGCWGRRCRGHRGPGAAAVGRARRSSRSCSRRNYWWASPRIPSAWRSYGTVSGPVRRNNKYSDNVTPWKSVMNLWSLRPQIIWNLRWWWVVGRHRHWVLLLINSQQDRYLAFSKGCKWPPTGITPRALKL